MIHKKVYIVALLRSSDSITKTLKPEMVIQLMGVQYVCWHSLQNNIMKYNAPITGPLPDREEPLPIRFTQVLTDENRALGTIYPRIPL